LKPAYIGINFADKTVLSTVGSAPLTDKEMKAINKIATVAFGRMLDSVLDTVSQSMKIGKRRGRPKKAAVSATGKRRGRPPKVRPAEVPPAAPAAV
jgi:hypothetical protein